MAKLTARDYKKTSRRAVDFARMREFGAGATTSAGVSITSFGIFVCALVGLGVTGLITYITEVFTGTTFP